MRLLCSYQRFLLDNVINRRLLQYHKQNITQLLPYDFFETISKYEKLLSNGWRITLTDDKSKRIYQQLNFFIRKFEDNRTELLIVIRDLPHEGPVVW